MRILRQTLSSNGYYGQDPWIVMEKNKAASCGKFDWVILKYWFAILSDWVLFFIGKPTRLQACKFLSHRIILSVVLRGKARSYLQGSYLMLFWTYVLQ